MQKLIWKKFSCLVSSKSLTLLKNDSWVKEGDCNKQDQTNRHLLKALIFIPEMRFLIMGNNRNFLTYSWTPQSIYILGYF